MKRRLLLIMLPVLLLAGHAARAGQTQEQIFAAVKERLQHSALLRADFRQERLLKILQRPLVSSGAVVLFEGEGILWRVEDPHAITYLIRPGEILEWEGGSGPRRIGMTAVPAFRLITEMFLGALSGDITALQHRFEAEALPVQAGWRLRLVPKSSALSDIISSLEVVGDRYVTEVRVQEVRGDAVRFTFGNFQTEPASLDASEQNFFAQ